MLVSGGKEAVIKIPVLRQIPLLNRMALEAGRSNAAVAGLLQPQKSCIESTFFYAQYLLRERTVGSLQEKRQRAVCFRLRVCPERQKRRAVIQIIRRIGSVAVKNRA